MAKAEWCLLVLASCVLGALGAPAGQDPIAFKNATWEKCKKQENVPDAAMKDLYFFKTVDGIKDHKCVMKCIDEEYGIYTKDGTISKEMIEQAIKGIFEEPELQKKLISKGIECVDTVKKSSDPCQYNVDLFDCFIKAAKKEGLNFEPE
ncbi:general odorant-binding protein 1 isoform X1 [Halyomorpha halys]|uniref:general odorant-binding protein 1 isoform X1 n=1 Tax=Halyomorpha halys TaxID=286706 RepID=UPI0006D518EB|nr:general odorant-binding protein 1 [Halyomorpha halys]KAE8573012.1 Odorant-binding protein 33 [Halyomorpha halys]